MALSRRKCARSAPSRSITSSTESIHSRVSTGSRSCLASVMGILARGSGSPGGSGEELSAVCGECGACDEACVFGCEEDDASGDLLRLSEASDGDLRDDLLLEDILVDGADHVGADV